MSEEIPKCKDCGQPMFEIGGTGKMIQYSERSGEILGIREEKLYQCPECKTVIIH